MKTRTRVGVVFLFSVLALLLRVQPAWAPYHIVVIEEVFFGTAECPNAQYVKLRTLAAGQVQVTSQEISAENADGSAAAGFGTFSRGLPRGQSGVAMLMATAQAEALFEIEADQEVTGQLVFGNGRVCFGDFGGSVDCVAYGNFTGDNSGYGSPAVASQLGMALVRMSETDNNSADFALGTPEPENNAGATGSLGAGLCLVGSPTPTPTPTTGETDLDCTGDCSGDELVTVDELIRGVNINLGSTTLSMCPVFDRNGDGVVTIDELIRAVNDNLNGCPVLVDPPTPTPTRIPGSLGRRRFSLDPEESGFRLVGLPIPIQGTGFAGFVDFQAGVPDPETGIAAVDIVDASEYLAISVNVPIGGVSIVICLKPDRANLPIRGAGALACEAGQDFSVLLSQDHNINDVDPTCATGTADQNPAHPGACNGAFMTGQLGEDTGAGALIVAPDPETFVGGFPVSLGVEQALPCGDEGVAGFPIPLAFTTGTFRATILDRGNIIGQTLQVEERGTNFSCENWEDEDGPGTVVFAAPVIDFEVPILGFVDVANVFFFTD